MDFGLGVKDVLEGIWSLFPDHWRRRLSARAADINPFSVIPTNHDLLRGARVAWVNASFEICKETESRAKAALRANRNDTDAGNAIMVCKLLRVTGKRLRDQDLTRHTSPRQSPIDEHVTMIFDLAGRRIAGLEEPGEDAPITEGFAPAVAGFVEIETDQVPRLLIATARDGVKTHRGANPRGFGTLLLDELAEIIKGDGYPELKEAYRVQGQVVILEEIRRLPGIVIEQFEADVLPKIGVMFDEKMQAATDRFIETVRQEVENSLLRETGHVDPDIVQRRVDQLIVQMTEREARERNLEVLQKKFDAMNLETAKGNHKATAILFNAAWRELEIEHDRHHKQQTADTLRLLDLGIENADALEDHEVTANRIVTKARVSAGSSAKEQFAALRKAYADWSLRAGTNANQHGRLVLWRLAEALAAAGFDRGRAFDGAVALGERLILLQFGEGQASWLSTEVVVFVRGLQARGLTKVVEALRARPEGRSLGKELAAIEEYARRLAAGEPPPTIRHIETMENWLVRSSVHARSGLPMSAIFDYASIELIGAGANLKPVPDAIARMVIGDTDPDRLYRGTVHSNMQLTGEAAALKAFHDEVVRRPAWCRDDVAQGIAHLEFALTVAEGQPPEEVGAVHQRLASAHEACFWWLDDATHAASAEKHYDLAAASFANAGGNNDIIARRLNQSRDEMALILKILASPPVAPPAPAPPKKGLFGL